MTVLHVYNLFDSTIETYVAQFLNTHDKLMKRECENIYESAKLAHSKNPLSQQGALYRYSDSYMMIHTADFDDQTGVYTPLSIPVTICNFGIFNTLNEKSDITSDEQIYSNALNSSSCSNS